MFVSGSLHCPVCFISKVFFLTGLYSERGEWMTHWLCGFSKTTHLSITFVFCFFGALLQLLMPS